MQAGRNREQLDRALYTAVVMNHPGEIPALIKQGANPDAQATNTQCLIHYAAYYGYDKVIDKLAEGGADIDRLSPRQGFSAAYIAAGQGKDDALARLIAHGADIHTPVGVNAQSPPLDSAVLTGTAKGVALLLENGADPFRHSRNGSNNLHIAAMLNKPATLDVLVQHGLDINHRNADGDTPAHLAAEQGNTDVLWLLKALGADLTIRNNKGKTADTALTTPPRDPLVRRKVSEFKTRQLKKRYIRSRKQQPGPR